MVGEVGELLLVFADDFTRPVAVVLIGGRVVGSEALESVVYASALGTRKNRLLCFQIMEASPPKSWVGGALLIAEVFSLSGADDSSDSVFTIPLAGGLKGGADAAVGLLHFFQKPDNGDAFIAAERCWFLHAGTGRGEGERVVLGAPNGWGAVDYDLSLQQAVNATGDGIASPLAAFIVDKGEGFFLFGDFVEKAEGVEHGVIVESDLVVIACKVFSS